MFTLSRTPKTTPSTPQIARLFDAAGDSTRLKIIRMLLERQELCVSQLREELGISMPGTSQQLKILELNGIVKKCRKGQKTCYYPNRDDARVKKLFKCIESLT